MPPAPARESTHKQVVDPPPHFGLLEREAYFACHAYVRIQTGGASLTPKETARFGKFFKAHKAKTEGKVLNDREKALIALFTEVAKTYNDLNIKKVGRAWSIREWDSNIHDHLTWSEVNGVALPYTELNAPRLRSAPPKDYPFCYDPEYLDTVLEDKKDKKQYKKEMQKDLEEADRKLKERLEADKKDEEERERLRTLKEGGEELTFAEEAELEYDEKYRVPEPHFVGMIDPDGKPRENPRLKTHANYSFQELGEPYQFRHFVRTLNELVHVRVLRLNHNMLTDLSMVKLPMVEELDLTGNNFLSFENMPKAPRLQKLDMCNNNVWSLRGLKSLKITELILRENPIEAENDYKERVIVSSHKNLQVLDEEVLDRHLADGWKAPEYSKHDLDGGGCILL